MFTISTMKAWFDNLAFSLSAWLLMPPKITNFWSRASLYKTHIECWLIRHILSDFGMNFIWTQALWSSINRCISSRKGILKLLHIASFLPPTMTSAAQFGRYSIVWPVLPHGPYPCILCILPHSTLVILSSVNLHLSQCSLFWSSPFAILPPK